MIGSGDRSRRRLLNWPQEAEDDDDVQDDDDDDDCSESIEIPLAGQKDQHVVRSRTTIIIVVHSNDDNNNH